MARRRHHRRKNTRAALIALGVLLLLIGLGMAVLVIRSRRETESRGTAAEASGYDKAEKWAEGIITYDGKNYLYNKNIRTYLFLGIDTDEPVHKAEDGISGGQSDGIFLLVEDRDKNKITIVSVNRNTMTNVSVYNEEWKFVGNKVYQICLQHGYGDGKRLSCQRAQECVSNLFNGIPIHGYLSLNMGGIGRLNDAVGGVEVTVLQDLDNTSRNVHLVEGETKVLNGDEAYVYCRSRDTEVFNTATLRLRRQEQYLNALIPRMLEQIRNGADAVGIYKQAEDYLYSNIDFARLADEMKDMEYDSSEGVLTIPGEVIMGEVFEEFWADEEGLYRLILRVFYDEVDNSEADVSAADLPPVSY